MQGNYFYKNISSEFISVRPFKLYKHWEFTKDNLGNEIQIYDALKSAGDSNNQSYIGPNSAIYDSSGRLLSNNYLLDNGHYYCPISESMVSGSLIKTYNGNEYYINQDGYRYYPPSGSIEICGFPRRNVWYSLWNLFYRVDDGVSQQQYSAIHSDKFISSSLSGSAYVFDIPRNYMGDDIKKKSFVLQHSNSSISGLVYNIYDDGNGNLYDSNTSTVGKIGNISYDSGLVIITNEQYRNYFVHSLEEHKQDADVKFEFISSVDTVEHEYTCVVRKDEFNMTTNPSAYDSGSVMKDFLVDDSYNLTTFVTTIGLYDAQDRLMAVAKIPRPIRIERTLDLIFVIRFDTN